MIHTMDLLVLSILLTSPILCLANTGVPVLVFRDASADVMVPRPLAGHTLSTDEFSKLFKSSKMPDLTISFLQDELSNEDFLRMSKDMKRGGLFANVQKYSERKSSTFFPSVKSASYSLRELAARYDDQVELNKPEEVIPYLTKAGLRRDTSLVVHLLPTADEETSSQAIQNNDALIGEVMRLVGESGLTYMAVFTGKQHRKAHEAIVMQGTGRHLLETAESPASNSSEFYAGDGCLVYVEQVNLINKTLDKFEISCKNETKRNGKDNVTYSVIVNFGDDIELTFTKSKVLGMWWLTKAIVDTVDLKGLPDISAPLGFSYHCNELSRFFYITEKESVKTKTLFLEIKRIQIQVFDFIYPEKFGYANDCTGFFTMPLWTGLLTALFLITVTMYGLMMLSSVQTFDQYDDPKSKPLQVNISE